MTSVPDHYTLPAICLACGKRSSRYPLPHEMMEKAMEGWVHVPWETTADGRPATARGGWHCEGCA